MNINQIFNYDDSSDQEIYFDEDSSNSKFKIQACTVANSDGKPNEDAFSIVLVNNVLWLAVFDGTTSLKSIPALKEQSGARFASHYLRKAFVKELSDTTKDPATLLINLNKLLLVQSLQLGGELSDTHSLPASMATIVSLDFENKILNFAHIGDTYGLTKSTDGHILLFTDDKNNKFDQEMFSLMKKIAADKNLTIRQARQDKELTNALYQMFIRRNNNPNGFGSGLVNGDPNAELYLQRGEYSLTNVESILLATDGLEIQGKSILDLEFQKGIFDILITEGLKGLVKRKQESEDNDPEWNFCRYKHSDDATGIFVSFDIS